MLASRIERLAPSPVRDILHALENPELISFAGGLPSPDSFPGVSLDAHESRPLLQYGASEGESALRELVAQEMLGYGVPAHPSRVLILSGSQQGIDLVAKLLIDSGTTVAIESPTYLAALQVFSLFGAQYTTLSFAEGAATIDDPVPALLYTNPTFQNPTGSCLGLTERRAVAELCDQTDAVLFEDDPYRELMYSPCDRTPICGLLDQAEWIYQSSFSKTIAPGLRIGFLCCSEGLYPHLLALKQAADLHSNRLGQYLVLNQLRDLRRHERIKLIRDDYRAKRDRFDALLQETMGDIADWSLPAGGLFFWLTIRSAKSIDTSRLLQRALEHNIAFMPGDAFYATPGTRSNSIRLNFSHASPARAAEGLNVLARLIRDVI